MPSRPRYAAPYHEEAAQALIDALLAQRETLALSDRAFAHRLGVSASLWYKVRDRKRPLRDLFRSRILQHYPELAPLLIALVAPETEPAAVTTDDTEDEVEDEVEDGSDDESPQPAIPPDNDSP